MDIALNEPYEEVERDEIQYTYCRDFDHISRYKGLRQVVHEGDHPERYIALETANSFESHATVSYYTVDAHHENRLDLIAQEQLGGANYAWVLAYFNNIDDGFTVLEGTKLRIPSSVSALFENGEVLAPIAATKLNLGTE